MESEAIDRRMVREATIGLVVLVALIGLLFLTIWLKAKSIWSDASEELLTAPVNVFMVDRSNVLVATKKPSPVPLPQIESNEIVDLGEMRPISGERMAAMFGTISDRDKLRVAAVDANIGLPQFPTPVSPGLPSSDLRSSGLPSPSLPSLNPQPLSPQFSNDETLPDAPTPNDGNSSSVPNLPSLPSLPGNVEEKPPAASPRIGATEGLDVMLASSVAHEVVMEESTEATNPTEGTTPIVFPSSGLPSPNLIATEPLLKHTEPSNVAENPAEAPNEEVRTSAPSNSTDPLNGALQRAAADGRLPPVPEGDDSSNFDPDRLEPTHPTDSTAPLANSSSVTQIQVRNEDDPEMVVNSPPPTYSADELKKAMRRIRLPQGMSMSQLSNRLYGDSRYAAALQQLNHRRADDRGRFLPGTQIAYLPGEMLAFVYPDLIPADPLDEEFGAIQPVEYQEGASAADGAAETPSRADLSTRAEPTEALPVETETAPNAATKTPEWVVTEGGESLFQLAVDHFDQASYYLYLYEWNRATFEGRYRATDPLPKGLRIRLTPPDVARIPQG